MKTKIMAMMLVAALCLVMTVAACWAMKDNGDGTITDGSLVWLKDANCFGKHGWYEVTDRTKALRSGMCGLKDNSSAGQWRLATSNEMVIRYGDKSGFSSIKEYYWTSTELASDVSKAHYMDMTRGYGNVYPKTEKFYAWPVRAKK